MQVLALRTKHVTVNIICLRHLTNEDEAYFLLWSCVIQTRFMYNIPTFDLLLTICELSAAHNDGGYNKNKQK